MDATNVTKRPRLSKKMKDFLVIFENQACRITISAENANINRRTYYRWLENPKFAAEIERVNEKFKDFVEGKIIKILKSGDIGMLKFYAKTKLKDRGYVEKQEIEHIGSATTIQLVEMSDQEIKDEKDKHKRKLAADQGKQETNADPKSS